MEIFIDGGLFELFAVLGVAALAKAVYARRWLAIAFLAVSVATPAVLLFMVHGEAARWLAALCLATALVNTAVVLGALQRGDVPTVTLRLKKASS